MDPRAGLDDLEKRKFLTLLGLALNSLKNVNMETPITAMQKAQQNFNATDDS
jgi:hypothetical protein